MSVVDEDAKLLEIEDKEQEKMVPYNMRKVKKVYWEEVEEEYTIDGLEYELAMCRKTIEQKKKRMEEVRKLLDETYRVVEPVKLKAEAEIAAQKKADEEFFEQVKKEKEGKKESEKIEEQKGEIVDEVDLGDASEEEIAEENKN